MWTKATLMDNNTLTYRKNKNKIKRQSNLSDGEKAARPACQLLSAATETPSNNTINWRGKFGIHLLILMKF